MFLINYHHQNHYIIKRLREMFESTRKNLFRSVNCDDRWSNHMQKLLTHLIEIILKRFDKNDLMHSISRSILNWKLSRRNVPTRNTSHLHGKDFALVLREY